MCAKNTNIVQYRFLYIMYVILFVVIIFLLLLFILIGSVSYLIIQCCLVVGNCVFVSLSLSAWISKQLTASILCGLRCLCRLCAVCGLSVGLPFMRECVVICFQQTQHVSGWGMLIMKRMSAWCSYLFAACHWTMYWNMRLCNYYYMYILCVCGCVCLCVWLASCGYTIITILNSVW